MASFEDLEEVRNTLLNQNEGMCCSKMDYQKYLVSEKNVCAVCALVLSELN